MILTITSVTIILVLILFRKYDKASPLFLFAFIWGTIIVLYQLKLFGIYDVGEYTQMIIALGVVSFIVGYIFMLYFFGKSRVGSKKETIEDINVGSIKILVLVIFILSFPFYISQIRVLVSNGLTPNDLKLMMVRNEVDSGGVVMQYLVRPFEYIIIAISAFFLLNKSKEWMITLSGVFFALLRFLTTGSKTALTVYVIAIFTIGFARGIKMNKRKNVNGIVVGLISLLLGYMVINGVFFKSIYYYACGSIPLLEKVIVTKSDFYGNELTYGFLSLNGIVRFIYNIFEVLGIDIKNGLFDLAYQYITRFEYGQYVGENVIYNAFVTQFAFFYKDFGMFGVIILSFLFGAVSWYIYTSAKNTNSLTKYVLLVLINYSIVYSMVRFQLSTTVIACSFIYAITLLNIIIYGKIKIKFM